MLLIFKIKISVSLLYSTICVKSLVVGKLIVNLHFIQQETWEELIDVINMIINEGHHLIPDELGKVLHIVNHGDDHNEVNE